MEFLELRGRQVERFPRQSLDLPADVLQLVFDYLNVRDRLTVSLVSRKWRRIVNQRRFLRDIVVVFQGSSWEVSVDRFEKMSRSFPCFVFRYSTINENVLKFLERFKDQILHFSFHSCLFHSKLELDRFPNLEYLSLSWCFNMDFLSAGPTLMRNLKSLSVDTTKLSDAHFSDLCRKAPVLKELLYTGGDLRPHRTELTGVNPEVLMECLQAKSNTLKSLSIKFTEIESSTLRTFANMSFLNLQKLCLRRSKFEDYDSGLRQFATRQRNLLSLDLGRTVLSNDDVQELCRLLPNLQELWLHCSRLSDTLTFQQLSQLRNLKKLVLQYLPMSKDFAKTFKETPPQLNVLSLDVSDNKLKDKDVQSLCEHFPNLRDLHLGGWHGNNTTTYRIFQLKNLKSLCLRNCEKISEEGLVRALSDSRCHLRELDVESCNLGDEFVDTVCERYHDLKLLNIRKCKRTTEKSRERLQNSKIKCERINNEMFKISFL